MRNLGEGCSIGRNSGIGQFGFIGCGGGVTIGENVIMGQFVSFHTENHLHADLERPIVSQGVRRAPVIIEDDVWVGVKVTFLSGAHVGHGSIVAAGAVVRGIIPPLSIIGGVPARIIGKREAREVVAARTEQDNKDEPSPHLQMGTLPPSTSAGQGILSSE
jgi:acetyltransferase-like isoleucine patch superfamily enzyme